MMTISVPCALTLYNLSFEHNCGRDWQVSCKMLGCADPLQQSSHFFIFFSGANPSIVPWLWDIYTIFVFPLYPYCGCVVFPFWDNSKVGGNRWVMGAINQPQMISLWHLVYHGLPHYLHLKLCVSSFLKIPSTFFAKFPKAVLVGFQTLDLSLVHHGLQGTQNRNGTLEPLLLLGWKTW